MAQYGEMLGGALVHYNTTSSTAPPQPQVSFYKQDQPSQQPSHIQQYGEMMGSFESSREKMYKDFDDYFNHPTMVKIKDVEGHSMYMSKTYCLLSNECRYIIVFVPQDNMPIRTKETLVKLRWVSLQTRTLADNHELPPHGYQPRRHPDLNFPIERVKVETDCSTYTCKDLPLTITLLHGKNGPSDYQQQGNVIAALETFQTILTLNNFL